MNLVIFALIHFVQFGSSAEIDYSSLPIIPVSFYTYDPSNSGTFDDFESEKTVLKKRVQEAIVNLPKDSALYKRGNYIIKMLDAIQSIVVSTSTNDLGKIGKGTDLLFINQAGAGKDSEPFDFSKLTSPMRIVFKYEWAAANSNGLLKDLIQAAYSSNLRNDDQSFLRFTNVLMDITKTDSKPKNSKAMDKIYIKGDCKDKVKFISFTSGRIRFVESNFTANFFIGVATIDETGKGIDSEYVTYTTSSTIPTIFYPVRKLFLVVNKPQNQASYNNCGIKFMKSGIFLKDEKSGINYQNNMLSSAAKEQFGFVSMFKYIQLDIEAGLTNVPSFNISLQEYESDKPVFEASKALADDKIEVTQVGNWEQLSTKVTIVIESYDPKKININSLKNVNIENKEIVKYVPTSQKKDGGLSVGAIVGIVIGCLAVVGIVVGVCVYFFVIKKKKAQVNNE